MTEEAAKKKKKKKRGGGEEGREGRERRRGRGVRQLDEKKRERGDEQVTMIFLRRAILLTMLLSVTQQGRLGERQEANVSEGPLLNYTGTSLQGSLVEYGLLEKTISDQSLSERASESSVIGYAWLAFIKNTLRKEQERIQSMLSEGTRGRDLVQEIVSLLVYSGAANIICWILKGALVLMSSLVSGLRISKKKKTFLGNPQAPLASVPLFDISKSVRYLQDSPQKVD